MEFFKTVVGQIISSVLASFVLKEVTAFLDKENGFLSRIKTRRLNSSYFFSIVIFSCIFFWLFSLYFEVNETKQALLLEIKQEYYALHKTIQAIPINSIDTGNEIEKINTTAHKKQLNQLLISYKYLYDAFDNNEYSNDEALEAKQDLQTKSDSVINLIR